MTTTIAQRDLRNDNADIMRAVEAGEDFIITRNGVPVAELRPIRRRRTFVSRADLRRIAEHLPEIDRERFRDDVDAVLDQSPLLPGSDG